MGYTLWISRKLKLNGEGGGVNATGVTIAVTGIALAVVIMEFTLAIVLGFKNQITDRVIGFEGKIWVLPDYNYELASSAATLVPDSSITSLVEKRFPGAPTHMRFDQPGILKTDDDFAGVYFSGEEGDSEFQRDFIIEGEYPDFTCADNSQKIVISKSTSKSIGIGVGDKVNACFFVNDAIKARKFEVAGIYETGFGDYDKMRVFTSIATLRKIAGADSTAGTRLMIDIPYTPEIDSQAKLLQDDILKAYEADSEQKLYPVDNVRHTGSIYFNWLELLNTNVVAIIVLMICVSGFTLVSSMFIIILERIPTIGILRALGAKKRGIRSIFVNIALRIVLLGLIIGNALGIGLLYCQKIFKVLTLDPEMYYLKYVPIDIDWTYMILLNVGVVVISWLILILPSRVASGISPAVTMRFE